jgi:hypothetical protein
MNRREFITLLGGGAAWPLAAHAQQPTAPVVAVLSGGSKRFPAFTDGIAEGGYHSGRNVSIEFYSVNGSYDKLPAIAQELVNRRVAVIARWGSRRRRQRRQRHRPSPSFSFLE